jgi:hypothetical protein
MAEYYWLCYATCTEEKQGTRDTRDTGASGAEQRSSSSIVERRSFADCRLREDPYAAARHKKADPESGVKCLDALTLLSLARLLPQIGRTC